MPALQVQASYEVHSHTNIQTVFRYTYGNPYLFARMQKHCVSASFKFTENSGDPFIY